MKLILDRLKKALKIGTDTQLAAVLGIKTNTLANWKSRGSIDYELIFTVCEKEGLDLNEIILDQPKIAPNVAPIIAPNAKIEYPQTDLSVPKWITVNNFGKENILFVPVKAAAGYLNGFGDPEYIEKLPAYNLPGFETGTYRMFEVDGNSMVPTLKNRDRIIGKWCPIPEIKDSYLHVVVTKNDGVVVKRVLNRIEKDGVLILKSDGNRYEHPDIIVDGQDIVECWRGVGKISRDLSGPADLYSRIDELEGRLAIVDEFKKRLAAFEKLLSNK